MSEQLGKTLPLVKALKGSFLVSGESKDGKQIYRKEVSVYGETLGELLDNTVEVSAAITADLSEWTKTNHPESYNFEDDYWHCSITSPSTRWHNPASFYDYMSTTSIPNLGHLSNFAVLTRHIRIDQLLHYLLLAKSGDSNIKDSPAVDFSNIYKTDSFAEMAKCGFTGSELDATLTIAFNEGRLSSAQTALYFPNQPEAPKSKKKRWF